MRHAFTLRIRLIAGFILLFGLVLIGRLYFIQIVHGDVYSERGNRQYVRPNQDLYDRGTIFFETKDGKKVSGATLASGFTIAIDPRLISDPEKVYAALNALTPLDRAEFMAHAAKKEDPYEEIADHVPEDAAIKIDGLDLPGVHAYRERWRFYPGGMLGAQTLGFVGFQGDTETGIVGLERYYNDVLARDTENVDVNFFAEVFSTIGSAVFETGKRQAGDVVTTLEPSVQQYLEGILKGVEQKYSSRLTGGIIMNPKDGSIYALAVNPTFDLNNFKQVEDATVFAQPLVEHVYEMGSIIKPLTMAAGLDSGAVKRTTTYNDMGHITLDGYTISNYDHKARGVVSMQEVLNQSLNTGVAFVVDKMGRNDFAKYMRAYDLGKETGIDLPNEAAGLITNLESPRAVEYATASFGQGIALSPVETIRALASLGNGGMLPTPHLGKEIELSSGVSKALVYPPEGPVLKKETSEEITRMLVEVVDKSLLGGQYKHEHYTIAAKTGTAQIAKEGARGYYDDRYLHSFFGYFPAYDPKFIIFLYTVEPKGVEYASHTLTEPFMELTDFLINYYDLPPDR